MMLGLGQQIIGTNLVVGTGSPGTLVSSDDSSDPMLTTGASPYDVGTVYGNPVGSSNVTMQQILGCSSGSLVIGSACVSVADIAFAGLAIMLVLVMGAHR